MSEDAKTTGPRRPPQKPLIEAFRRYVAPALRERGFRGRAGHYLRAQGVVDQVIELQPSVFGSRVTANLGVDLRFLEPAMPWVRRARLGARAHECTRWVRIGLAGSAGADVWWSYGSREELSLACDGLLEALLAHGLGWLDEMSSREAFLTHAAERLERSKGPRHPEGRWSELRVFAATLAWNERVEQARVVAELAESLWIEECARLSAARARYLRSSPCAIAEIPDLQAELVRLVSTPAVELAARGARRVRQKPPSQGPT